MRTAFTTGQNYTAADVPAGNYRVAIATVTAVFFEVGGITGSP